MTNAVDTNLSLLPTEDEIISSWGEWSSPVVSVVCAFYNQEKYVSDALKGFLRQRTSFPFEIVIGEDCSTDGTPAVLESYRQRYPRLIRIVSGPRNVGAVKNGLRAIAVAKGRYIALCDGDDYWQDPQKLQTQVDFLEANPEYVVCHHDVKVIDGAGKLLRESLVPPWARRDWSSEDMICGRAAHMPTATLCLRNVRFEYPPEFHNLLNGSGGLMYPYLSLLGHYGHAKFLGQIGPSVYRRLQSAVWTGLSDAEKKMASLTTLYLTFKYYQRVSPDRYAGPLRQRYLAEAWRLCHPPRRTAHTRTMRWVLFAERTLLRVLLALERAVIRSARTLVSLLEPRTSDPRRAAENAPAAGSGPI